MGPVLSSITLKETRSLNQSNVNSHLLRNLKDLLPKWKQHFLTDANSLTTSSWLIISFFITHTQQKAMAPHSSTLAWKIPWTEEPGRLQSMGSLRVGNNWATSLSLFTFMDWRGKWQPTPVFLPGESGGWGSLVGSCLCGRTESDMTEATQQQQHTHSTFSPDSSLIFPNGSSLFSALTLCSSKWVFLCLSVFPTLEMALRALDDKSSLALSPCWLAYGFFIFVLVTLGSIQFLTVGLSCALKDVYQHPWPPPTRCH